MQSRPLRGTRAAPARHRYDSAADDAKASVEQAACTPAMHAACECVCDLYGLERIDEDLKGVLLMAAAFGNEQAEEDEVSRAAHADQSRRLQSCGHGAADPATTLETLRPLCRRAPRRSRSSSSRGCSRRCTG